MDTNTAVLIVNSIAAFAAVVAAIIAIVVYKKTAKLQMKAINYSLLNDRISIWKYMEHDRNQYEAWITRVLEGRDWKLEQFKLLFSQELVNEFNELCKFKVKSSEINYRIDFLEREGLPVRAKSDSVNEEYRRFAEINHRRKELQSAGINPSAPEWIEFKELCQKYFQNDCWKEYFQCLLDYMNLPKTYDNKLSVFLEHMQVEIKNSVLE